MAKYANPQGGVREHRTLKLAHTADVEQYEVIVVNGQVLVATDAYAADEVGIYIFRGPVEFDKEAALAVAPGEVVYWDGTANEADKTDTNTKAGICKEASAAAATTVLVELLENI